MQRVMKLFFVTCVIVLFINLVTVGKSKIDYLDQINLGIVIDA